MVKLIYAKILTVVVCLYCINLFSYTGAIFSAPIPKEIIKKKLIVLITNPNCSGSQKYQLLQKTLSSLSQKLPIEVKNITLSSKTTVDIKQILTNENNYQKIEFFILDNQSYLSYLYLLKLKIEFINEILPISTISDTDNFFSKYFSFLYLFPNYSITKFYSLLSAYNIVVHTIDYTNIVATNDLVVTNSSKYTLKKVQECLLIDSNYKHDKINFIHKNNVNQITLSHFNFIKDQYINCIFDIENSKIKQFFIYNIIVYNPHVTSSPKVIHTYYHKNSGIQRQTILFHSTANYQNLYLTITTDDIYGSYPDIFSESRKWTFDHNQKRYSLIDDEKNNIPLKFEYGVAKIELIYKGNSNNSFLGKINVYNGKFLIVQVPLIIKPYLLFSIIFDFIVDYYYYFILIIFLIILTYTIKYILNKKQIQKLHDEVEYFKFPLHRLLYAIEVPFHLKISKKDNPFNCSLPFIKTPIMISTRNSMVEIYSNKKNKHIFDLNESQGIISYKLFNNISLSIQEKKFENQGKISSVLEIEIIDVDSDSL